MLIFEDTRPLNLKFICPNICPILSVQHNWASESDTRIIHTTFSKLFRVQINLKQKESFDRKANARTKTIQQKM